MQFKTTAFLLAGAAAICLGFAQSSSPQWEWMTIAESALAERTGNSYSEISVRRCSAKRFRDGTGDDSGLSNIALISTAGTFDDEAKRLGELQGWKADEARNFIRQDVNRMMRLITDQWSEDIDWSDEAHVPGGYISSFQTQLHPAALRYGWEPVSRSEFDRSNQGVALRTYGHEFLYKRRAQ